MKTSIITDHALLRWIERAEGVDVEALRAHVAARCADPVRAGCSLAQIGNVWAEIRGGRVVTFLPKRPTQSQIGRYHHGARR